MVSSRPRATSMRKLMPIFGATTQRRCVAIIIIPQSTPSGQQWRQDKSFPEASASCSLRIEINLFSEYRLCFMMRSPVVKNSWKSHIPNGSNYRGTVIGFNFGRKVVLLKYQNSSKFFSSVCCYHTPSLKGGVVYCQAGLVAQNGPLMDH
mgnify:CR=1 FL=1